MLDYRHGILIGMPFTRLIPAEYHEPVLAEIARFRETGASELVGRPRAQLVEGERQRLAEQRDGLPLLSTIEHYLAALGAGR